MNDSITAFSPLLISIVIWGAILWGAHWLLLKRQPNLGNERKFPRQLIMLALTITALITAILALPINESSRNQLLGLIGLIISGVVAFSSTTIVSNLMAGLLLRITKPFRIGDFVCVGEHFGRVSERGLFDTEIQIESRELVSLPNTYFINNPVTTTRSSGTIISHTLSLGYDLHHSKIEPLLIQAAEQCGLSDPFVQITQLGDFSVNYRIAGLLTEVKQLLTARSNLCRHILDSLHEAGIEIVSPAYMNQRPQQEQNRAIPRVTRKAPADENEVSESSSDSNSHDIAFDKAEQAEKVETRRQKLKNDIKQLEADLKEASEQDTEEIKDRIQSKSKLLEALEKREEQNKDAR